ncbi:MAG: hypothetical protein WCO66_02125 [Candidatus Absconditabacteria bacterium]
MKPQNILHRLYKNGYIKCLMLILIIVIGYGFHPVFAASEAANKSTLDSLASILNQLMNTASRARIPIATLAGKFMSNDMIYGSWFHLDTYLWQMRNISKNFANFGLLGFLLYEISKSLGKGSAGIQKTIGKVIIAGIGIQMSWFLVGAIIDVSTIATTAVASFPASFLGDTDAGRYMDTRIENTVKRGMVVLDKEGISKIGEITKDNQTTAQTKNQFMPKYDSVGGPLIFIGSSALGIQDMMTIKEGEDQGAKSILVTFGLKGFILIFYIIILILLLIANIIRVGYLWIFIAISPIIILLLTFMKDEGLGKEGLGKQLTFSNFIAIVFKPTIFVAVLGIILIFVTSIQSMLLSTSNTDINGISINQTDDQTKLEIPGVASVTTVEKILPKIGNQAQSIIPNLIVYFATLFLLWLLVKTALGSGTDPIAGVMKGAVGDKGKEGFIENMAKTTPLMNGMGYNALKTVSNETINKTTDTMAKGVFGKDTEFNMENGTFRNKTFEKYLRRFTGGLKPWHNNELASLQKTASTGGDFLKETGDILNDEHEAFSGKSGFYKTWEDAFKVWLAKGKGTTGFEKKTPEELTKEDWNIIHKALGGEEGDAPKNYEEFQSKEYKTKENK